MQNPFKCYVNNIILADTPESGKWGSLRGVLRVFRGLLMFRKSGLEGRGVFQMGLLSPNVLRGTH